MTRSILCLALTALCVSLAHAAPAPTPTSESPVGDALAVRALLPYAAPPTVTAAVTAGDGVIEMELQTVSMVAETRVRKVLTNVPETREETANVTGPDGKIQTVKRQVTVYVPVAREEQYTVTVPVITAGGAKARMTAKACRFFTVTTEGKLEALDAAKAATLLKTRKSVLTGESAEVDPRNLELIKAGTLYIAVPSSARIPEAPPPPPEGKTSSLEK
jgi:hypothetical protein